VTFRVNDDEMEMLKKHSGGIGLSAWCRDTVLKELDRPTIDEPPFIMYDGALRRTIQFLLNDEDYIRLLQAVADYSVSEWCRSILTTRMLTEQEEAA
jgi:hypothetical protein